MSFRLGSLGSILPALAMGMLLAHCGEESPAPPADAGTNPGDPVPCTTNEQCPQGWICQAGVCAENSCASDSDCSGGWKCNLLTAECEPGDAPDGGDPGDGGSDEGDGGTTVPDTCQSKYDCPAGLICKQQKCEPPAADDSCSSDIDCPRGELCNFSKKCEPGCLESRDCDAPELCHPQKFVCETCSLTNPCPAGKSCLAGECQEVISCTSAQDCVNGGADGAVCLGGFCSNCGGHGDCNVAPYNQPGHERLCGLDGLCKEVECTDQGCREQLGERAYCDTSMNPPSCAIRECLSNADCPQSGTVCDLNTNRCVGGGGANCTGEALETCEMECMAQFSQCNPATCNCGGGGVPGSGQEGDMCFDSSDCAQGYACGLGICTEEAVDSLFGGPCDFLSCFMGCEGAVTGRQCDPIGCMMSSFLGEVACL